MGKDKNSSKKEVKNKISLINIETLILLGLFFIFLANHLYPKKEITQAQLGINNWPLSSKKRLQMAEAYFNNGYEKEANEEFKKAEVIYSSLSFLDILANTKKHVEETKALLSFPEKIRQDINYLETVLKSNPHFRDVFLRLSILNYQLYQHKKTREYWEKAFYLDPNNKVIQKLGKIIVTME